MNNKRIVTSLLAICAYSICTVALFAQTGIRGTIKDAITQQPVEMATIQLLKGNDERLVSYTLTDSKGAFFIPSAEKNDSLQLLVSLLGYKSHKQAVKPGETHHILLEEQSFSLKEVEIRPGRVWGQQDTINYNVSEFLSANDQSVKDVLRKLPGINVDDLGRILYNGKEISNFYIEGMDLSGGRYNRITNNLQANAIETVQLLENHQPIRLLKDRIKVDDVALNLKLKPEFRDKWMVNMEVGIGYSKENFLRKGALDAMQLSRKSQSAYLYKGNNTGEDVSEEQIILTGNAYGTLQSPDASPFISQPSFYAPLKKEKLLHNNVHSLSANRLYRLNEDMKLRINAGYTHDKQIQKRGSVTTYYQQQDSLSISEQSNTKAYTDEAELGFSFENNAENVFLTNDLNLSGEWDKSLSTFIGKQDINQEIKTTNATAKNEFRSLWNRDKNTYEVRSLTSYAHLPGMLAVNEHVRKLHINRFYTDNSFSYIHKRGVLTHQYTAGTNAQLNNIMNSYGMYITPMWQLSINKWQGTFSSPLRWNKYPGANTSRFSPNPLLSIRYKYNYAWSFSFNGNYREELGDIKNFYTLPYQTDYRNVKIHTDFLPVNQRQTYRIYAEYKNTIQEFFSTLAVSYSRNKSNQIFEQLFEDELVILASRNIENYSSAWTVRGAISKGFYDIRMKLSLDYTFSHLAAKQLNMGSLLPYQHRYMEYEPKMSWNPFNHIEATYQGSFRYGGTKIGEKTELTPLWNIVQKLQISYGLFPFSINLSADHYYNDINKDKSVNAVFLNTFVRWKSGSWQLDFYANNLFNKKEYAYTNYSSLESYYSWIKIRGREYMVSAKYSF